MWGNVYTTRNDVGSDIAREPSGRDLSGFHYAKPKRRTRKRGTVQLARTRDPARLFRTAKKTIVH